MTERIPDPIAGQDVLPWAGKVTRRLNALDDKAGAQSRNERLHETQLPQPFEVRWDGTLNNWAGGWKIYLPAGDLVVLPKGVTIDPTDDLTALGSGYPDGWYLVPATALAVDASGTLYLNITLGDSPSAEFSSSASAADENEIAIEICATSVGTNPAKHEVDQFVTSAIVFGGDGEVKVDDKSVDWRQDQASASAPVVKKLEIKGWKTQAAALTSLVEALGLPLVGANNNNDNFQSEGASGSGSGSESGSGSGSSGSGSSREVVVRNGPDGALEYVPLGIVDLARILANIGNGTITIKQGDTTLGYFTVNQAGNTTVTIPEPQIPTVGDGTITIKQGDTTLGYFTVNQAGNTTVTIPAGVALTDATPSDAVLSTGTASAGSATTAARADHVHKLPSTVVDTVHGQTINGYKRFTLAVIVGGSNASGSTEPRIGLYPSGVIELFGSEGTHIDFHYAGDPGNFTSRIIESSSGVLELNSPNHARLAQAPIVDPTASGYHARQIATVGVVKTKQTPVSDPTASGTAKAFIDSITQNENGEITVTKKNVDIPAAQVQSDWDETDSTSKAFIKNKPTIPNGSVVVLRKVKYDTSTKKIMAAYSKINLATGVVTAPSSNEIPADNDATLLWAEVTEAVPHSSASASS